MLIVFGFALLLLTAAVVVLFAMLGELATRVPDPDDRPVPVVRPLDGTNIGREPGEWPAGLPDRDDAVILVLSTVCASCQTIAKQLAAEPEHLAWAELGLVISTGAREGGEDFVTANRLGSYRHHVDEGGAWTRAEFAVEISPTALVFRGGRLASAHTFNDVAALRDAVRKEMETA
ncbi:MULTISPECIES: hypothetical protein [unclassified Actinomadura]|uniref:hypothetical protein n=1 Tax=unclassified Actinomadura TaxID=2626254 RepID=UPI0011EDE76D|nr:hypothetical protein [Actinomadura sp. K4S16]